MFFVLKASLVGQFKHTDQLVIWALAYNLVKLFSVDAEKIEF